MMLQSGRGVRAPFTPSIRRFTIPCHMRLSMKSLKLSPSKIHIFKTVSQEFAPVMSGAATSQRTAAVPAMAPSAAIISIRK